MTEITGAVVQPFYAAFSSGDLESLDGCFASDWRDNTLPPGRAPGLEGMKQAIRFLRSILPDLTATLDDVRIDGDVVTVRVTFRGTNRGGWPGVAPTHAPVSFLAIDMHRIEHGLVAESWHLEDNLALMIQLGVIPPLG